jgi:pullulanase
MKNTTILLFAMLYLSSVVPTFAQNYPVYTGNDLGVHYFPEGTIFKVWAPNAEKVVLRLFAEGDGGEALKTINLEKQNLGAWQLVVPQNIKNQYYTFQLFQDGKWLLEKPDIYAKAVGVNGKRGMIVDLKSTNPKGWEKDKSPIQKSFTDIILYELHVRDLSMDANSGITNKGKFLGLSETGTKSPDGEMTGLDHIKDLGVTHIHLLPSFDYNSIDETKSGQYNWGYDPSNYNALEGSYATNAYDGTVRIKEFKKMVQTLHANGLRVVLDVVYNHTSNRDDSGFNQFAPGYFYRHNADGSYSDATACGNETASEQPMMRKFIIESLIHWVKEYHIDGFRFDLMGVHDTETMNQISAALHKIDPTIFLYGEGWTAGKSPMKEELRAVKKNTFQLKKIAAFSDDIRDGIHGPYSDVKVKGFVSGAPNRVEDIKFGIVASVQHPQIDYKKVTYSKEPWSAEPYQTINYAACHDDNTLFDRLKIGNPNATETELIQMDKLSNAIVLTSQGVPFLHAGSEMLRTKQGVHNSYKSPDSINQLDWSRKKQYKSVYKYYKDLIVLRKNHPAFRMPSAKMINEHLRFLDFKEDGLVGYQINNHANGDQWKDILVLFNGNTISKTVKIPDGNWTIVVNPESINEKSVTTVSKAEITLQPTSAYVLYKL